MSVSQIDLSKDTRALAVNVAKSERKSIK
uniref:Uncharacterized protein n=1 Tax=Nelumbo nucifera TaxID=4432 RepID=A0A822YDJ6_NELNU|nr:TPA_asm: hypothetical protein HUJ06_009273 [Nelumbo nucifera]